MEGNNTARHANDKLLYWILGALFAVLMAFMGYWLNGLDRRLISLENDFKLHNADTRGGFERTRALEEYVKYNDERIKTNNERLTDLIRELRDSRRK